MKKVVSKYYPNRKKRWTAFVVIRIVPLAKIQKRFVEKNSPLHPFTSVSILDSF